MGANERGVAVVRVTKQDLEAMLVEKLGGDLVVEMIEVQPATQYSEVSLYVRSHDYANTFQTTLAEFIKQMTEGTPEALDEPPTKELADRIRLADRQDQA